MSTKEACLKLTDIRTDAGTQSRCVICEDVVSDYAERMVQGDKFPAVTVFHDGTDYFLADGFHRVLAAVRNEFKDILAEVRKGTKLDAIKFSIGANKSNGLRRTNADKRKCVWLALENFGNLSNVAIAEMAGVSDPFVLQVRKTYETAHPGEPLTVRGSTERVGRDGKTRRVAEKKVEPEPQPEPEQPKTLDTQLANALGFETAEEMVCPRMTKEEAVSLATGKLTEVTDFIHTLMSQAYTPEQKEWILNHMEAAMRHAKNDLEKHHKQTLKAA